MEHLTLTGGSCVGWDVLRVGLSGAHRYNVLSLQAVRKYFAIGTSHGLVLLFGKCCAVVSVV